MTVLDVDRTSRPEKDDGSSAFRVRVAYRDSTGEIHLDWSPDRIKEAVDDAEGTVWVDIEDLESKENARAEAILREVFGFHELAIEDALKETHVPKVDDWGDYLYLVFHTIDFDPDSDHVRLHELDIFLGLNYVVTYHTETLEFLELDRRNIARDPANRMRRGAPHFGRRANVG